MKILKIIKYFFKAFGDLYLMIITYWPGELGYKLRYYYYRPKLKYLGKDVLIDVGVLFKNPEFISIGNHCWIDRNVIIMAGEDNSNREKHFVQRFKSDLVKKAEVIIGDNAHIGVGSIISGISSGVYIGNNHGMGSGCKIYAFSHHYRSMKDRKDTGFAGGTMVPQEKQCIIEGAVVLEDNASLATNAMVLPGTLIRKNSMLKINSVASGIYEENSLIEGYPGKRIGNRFKVEQKERTSQHE